MASAIGRYRFHALAFVLGLILGIAAYARIGPSAVSLDPGVQAALLLVISVTLAATAGAAGAVIGANIAAEAVRESASLTKEQAEKDRDAVSQAREADRQDARRDRFIDRRLALVVDMMVEADAHKREAEANVGARAEKWEKYFLEDDAPGSERIDVPSIGPSEAVRRAFLALDILAPRVSEVAQDLYMATVMVGEWATVYVDQGTPQGDAWWQKWNSYLSRWANARGRFVEAVQADLGVSPDTTQ
jgi:hypothetical protein